MEAYAFATLEQRNEVEEMLAWWRLRKSIETGTERPPERQDTREFEIVILLEDLQSGQTVPARVLTPSPVANEVQAITALGKPSGGYMRWGFKPSPTADTEWTENIYPMIDTAEVITRYLGALPSVGPGNARVSLGLIRTGSGRTFTEYNTWRWLVQFCGRYAGVDVPSLEIDEHLIDSYVIAQSQVQWVDTGKVIDVSAPIPVPFPTPMRRGSIAAAFPKRRVGYVVIACEPRDFGDYGLF